MISPGHTRCTHAGRARRTIYFSYASLCAQLLSIFWRSYSEFAANVQRTASALQLSVYRAHTPRVHSYMLKIWRIRAHILVVFENFGKRISIGKPRVPLLTHSLAQKHCIDLGVWRSPRTADVCPDKLAVSIWSAMKTTEWNSIQLWLLWA